jgi:hypothetical protein
MPAQQQAPPTVHKDNRMLDIDSAMQCPPGEVFCLASMLCVPEDEDAPCEPASPGQVEHKCDSGQVSIPTFETLVQLQYTAFIGLL